MAASGAMRKYKVVLLGDVGVGKSMLFETVKSLKEAGRREQQSATPLKLGYGTSTEISYRVYVGDVGVLFSLWDTGGVERFRTITRNYYSGTKAFIYVYNTYNRASLDGLLTFITEGNSESSDALRVLVGNTNGSPDPEARLADEQVVNSFARQQGFLSTLRFRLSVTSKDDVLKLFQTIAEHLIEGYSNPPDANNTVTLGPGPGPGPLDPGCCLCG